MDGHRMFIGLFWFYDVLSVRHLLRNHCNFAHILLKGFCHGAATGLAKMVCFILTDVIFHDWSMA